METRSLEPADIGRSFDIRTRAFGTPPEDARAGWEADVRHAIDERRVIAVYDADLLVARALIRPFRQWWHGRDLAMAGVAGVVVSPEYRGRGVGSALMRGVIERGRELGYLLSVLYPATVPVYRERGWEIAGVQNRVTIEARLLRDLRGGAVTVRETGPGDAGEMVELMSRHYTSARASGPKSATEGEMRHDLDDSSVFAYRAEGGFVVYGWEGSDLVVYQLLADCAETARALWAVVGSGSSIAKHVHAYIAPDDPLHQLLGETVSTDTKQSRWMLRCLDVREALGGRGFPAGVDIDVPVVIADHDVSQNCLAGRLRVADGAGEFCPAEAEAGAVRLGANGLAALYAGAPMSTLVTSGLASGGDELVHAQLDAAFGCRAPYLLEYF